MSEEWKVIECAPNYQVSSLGRVKGPGGRNQRGKILKPDKNHRGYLRVQLYVDGKGIKRNVAALVLEAFVGPRPAGYQCDHLNFETTDNKVSNLKWIEARTNRLRCRRIRTETHCHRGHKLPSPNAKCFPCDKISRIKNKKTKQVPLEETRGE